MNAVTQKSLKVRDLLASLQASTDAMCEKFGDSGVLMTRSDARAIEKLSRIALEKYGECGPGELKLLAWVLAGSRSLGMSVSDLAALAGSGATYQGLALSA